MEITFWEKVVLEANLIKEDKCNFHSIGAAYFFQIWLKTAGRPRGLWLRQAPSLILLLPTQERGYKIVHHISDGEKRKTQLHYSFPCTQSWRGCFGGCFGGCNQPIEADDKVKWILPQTSSISYLNCKHKTSSFKGVQKPVWTIRNILSNI